MNTVKTSVSEEVTNYVLGLLPSAVCNEVTELCHTGEARSRQINEIRLRAGAPSTVIAEGKMILLHTRLDGADIDKLYMKICHGTPFAYKECIINGYIPLSYGVRVGVGGEARYDGGVIVGVSGISVLVFRLPTCECSFGEELYRDWRERGCRNMLVCSPPAIGKTTVLRSLVRSLSRDKRDKNIVVVDERHEFYSGDYSDSCVDVLSGYKRHVGVDIAIRTMSAHYVVVDEIGRRDECEAMLSAYGCGVGILASAHGASVDEIRKRACILEMLELGVFSLITLIERKDKIYSYRICEV